MSESSRIEKLLSLIFLEHIKENSQAYKIVALSRVGFSNPEVADLLSTTAAVVAQTLYSQRSVKKPRGKKIAAASKKSTVIRRR